jgi:hypothetical protein
MTTRRRLLVFGLLAGLLVLGVGVLLLWPRTAITRENAAKIQVGMALADVEALLGGPARNEGTGATRMLDEQPKQGLHHSGIMRDVESRAPLVEWNSDYVMICVPLDSEERVSACHYLFLCPAEGALVKLRRWLRL